MSKQEWHSRSFSGTPDWVWRLLDAEVEADEPVVAALASADHRGDAVADELVRWLATPEGKGGRRRLDEALATPDRIADETPVGGLLAALADPPWLDRRAVARGSDLLLARGASYTFALGSTALMGGYLSGRVSSELALTGALVSKAERRLVETTRFVVDITTSGGLERGSAGWRSAVRTRIIHAHVRRGLVRSPNWRADWGEPISQRHMVFTLLAFAFGSIFGTLGLGHVSTRKEYADIVAFWRYVGFLIGIDASLLPATLHEFARIAYVIDRTDAGPNDDSRQLARALQGAFANVEVPDQEPGKAGRFLTGYARFFLGKRSADALGIADDRWKYAPLTVIPVVFAKDLVRRIVPGARARAVRDGRTALLEQIERDLARTAHVPDVGERIAAGASPLATNV